MSAVVLPTPHSSKAPLPTHSYTTTTKIIGIDTLESSDVKLLCTQLPNKTSVASVCFNGTIWEKIDAVASAGFDFIEIMTPDLDEAPACDIYDYCCSRNLSVSILQPFRDLEGYPDETFAEKLKEFETFLQTCQELHTDTLLLCANCDPTALDDEELVVSQLRTCAQLAAKYNIKVAYENLLWATHYYEFGRLADIVLQVNEANFGVCVDTFHVNIHHSPISTIDKLHGKVFFVQFCDSPLLNNSISIIDHARNYRVFPFQGDYDNNLEIYEKVTNAGYSGCLSLEVFNRLFKEKTGQCSIVAGDALRSLIYLQAVYSDTKKGTHFLPNVSISAVSAPAKVHDLSELVLSFESEKDIASFQARGRDLGYFRYISTFRTAVQKCTSLVVVDVPSRMLYNRYTFFLLAILLMHVLHDHESTRVNEINLPLQTCFGNNDELVLITLRIMAE